MKDNNIDVIQRAKELVLESPIMKYGITPERIEQVFTNVHMMLTQEELEKEYNPNEKYDGRLEGFNRNHHCYFGPKATPHIVIHEILHELSSEFDKDGHRTVNGIAKDNTYSQILLNEGMIDYLASKISGEEFLHYAKEKSVIARLEQMLLKQSGNPDVLFQILFKDKNRINEFISDFAKPDTANKMINRFEFMSQEDINLEMDQIEKKFNRHNKIEQIKARISSIFHRRKALPPGISNPATEPQERAKIWREQQTKFKIEYNSKIEEPQQTPEEPNIAKPIINNEEQSL